MRPGYVLGLLFSINLLNYVDRQVLYAVFPLIKPDLHLSDTELGALASAFMLVYMCAAPLVGYWGDRTRRSRWIASGVGLWSLATLCSGLSRSYGQLLASRSAIGVGEAGYGSVSPSFIAEHFDEAHRGRVLAFFYMAIPVGSAIGYVLGGVLGQHFGWRAAFWMVGAPGLLTTVLAWPLAEPPRPAALAGAPKPKLRDYAVLLHNRTYVLDTLATAAMTFALGGLAAWMPSYFVRNWGVSVAQAGTWFGGVTVVAGAGGSIAGGWLADWLKKRTPHANFLLSGTGMLLAVPFGLAMLYAADLKIALICLFAAEFLTFLNTGPLNAVIVECTPLAMRSMAFAANIFFIHALGDALSPAFIGFLADKFSLRLGLASTLAALLISSALCFYAGRGE